MDSIHAKLDPKGQIPSKGYPTDAGWDIYASMDIYIPAGKTVDVPTSIFIQMPTHLWGLLIGRSSMLRKHDLMIQTAVIDPGYRGELFVIVTNIGKERKSIWTGQRIAQFVPIEQVPLQWVKVDTLEPSERGNKGLGSTGA